MAVRVCHTAVPIIHPLCLRSVTARNLMVVGQDVVNPRKAGRRHQRREFAASSTVTSWAQPDPTVVCVVVLGM